MNLKPIGPIWYTNKRDEEEEIKEAINMFDQNGDGFITMEEL
jgi:Ca2+-binding EF-hand superfamily protein